MTRFLIVGGAVAALGAISVVWGAVVGDGGLVAYGSAGLVAGVIVAAVAWVVGRRTTGT